MSTARKAVETAAQNPTNWIGDEEHEEQVVYAAGTFTVGSNGDTQDFATAGKAAEVLEYQWELEDARK